MKTWNLRLWWPYAVLLAAGLLSIPTVPALVVGALLQAGNVYAFAKSRACVRWAILLCVLALSHWLMMPRLLLHGPVPEVEAAQAAVVGLAGIAVLGIATIIGILWRPAAPRDRGADPA